VCCVECWNLGGVADDVQAAPSFNNAVRLLNGWYVITKERRLAVASSLHSDNVVAAAQVTAEAEAEAEDARHGA
jgi:hypothetical protein